LSWLDRSLLLDLTRKLPNTFLTKVDVATMAHSLEARCPLLDYRVLELSAAIPHTLKVKNGHT
ncbi:MAG: hypothetical protein GTO41_28015, partial [Burkholderiales bacterium]|nr:hypothetical protein [Burkholderiales bacterium]